MLIAEGEIAAHMFVVLGGEVEVLHKGGSDHDVRVALLGPGDWIGEMAILDVQPRSASVRSLAPTTLLRIGFRRRPHAALRTRSRRSTRC